MAQNDSEPPPSLWTDRVLVIGGVLIVIVLAAVLGWNQFTDVDAANARSRPGSVVAPSAGQAIGVAPVQGQGDPAGASGDTAEGVPGEGAAGVVAAAPVARPDPAWVDATARATGIPPRALTAYATAHLAVAAEQPGCGVAWNTLAAIGNIESSHGTHGGATLGADGYPNPAIRGPALDGNGVAAIPDTDGGVWDADARWDRAVGPMQFIPDTWARWGADANGDGKADPNQIDDAALATARYLCAGGEMTSASAWRAAIFSYNHLNSYVDDVAAAAQAYARAAG